MKTQLEDRSRSHVAMTVAPEDLARGAYVAVLNEVVEVPTFIWCELPAHPPEEPVRIKIMSQDCGMPLKVQAVCLPFVCVRHPDGFTETLDVRRVQLVHVTRSYARCVWKAARKLQKRQQPVC